MDQQQKFARFKALHAGPGAFVMPNPWDAGSARVLESLGFEALATTSAGFAFSLGRRDSCCTRAEVLANAAAIVAAVDLPVSGDLEEGFGPRPQDCAETIRMAAATGLVGGSIEDATGDPATPVFAFDEAVARVRAAAEAARGLPFLLTARAENFLCDRPDLDDTIRRLQAYAEAGAEVLFAPGLPDLDAVRAVCAAVDRPVNLLMGLSGDPGYSVADAAAAGARRISTGASLARAALGGLHRAAEELRGPATATFAAEALPGSVVGQIMTGERPSDRLR